MPNGRESRREETTRPRSHVGARRPGRRGGRRRDARPLAGDGGEQRQPHPALQRPRGRWLVDHGFAHLTTKDLRRRQAARRALRRAGLPGRLPVEVPRPQPQARARAEARQRARCARPAYRRAHRLLCPPVTIPKANRALKQAMRGQATPAQWDPTPRADRRPGDQLDPAPDGQGALVRLPREAELRPRLPREPANRPPSTRRQLGRGLRLRPGHRHQRAPRPADRPRTNMPFNIWCAGQTILRDGRVVVAGGNLVLLRAGGVPSTRATTWC